MDNIFENIKNLLISKKFLEAENVLNEALSNSPEDKELIKLKAELRLKKGESLWDEGNIESALDSFIEALQLDPENKEIILKCGNILIELDQIESAKNLYENYLKKYPDDNDILKALSILEIPSDKTIKLETPQMKVSAIISTYNSEKFIKGCLEDLINQTLYKKGELEIVVIDSASKQNEKEIIKASRKNTKT